MDQKKGAGEWQYDFFLSYRGPDEALADRVRTSLLAGGYRVYMQKYDIPTGDTSYQGIDRGVEQSHRVLALYTFNYAESPYTMNLEFEVAGKNRKLIILRVDSAQLPILFSTAVCQDLPTFLTR